MTAVDPVTDEQRAQWRRAAEAQAEHDKALRSVYADRRARAIGPLRKILEMHQPYSGGTTWFVCQECRFGGAAMDWPCPTARLALEES